MPFRDLPYLPSPIPWSLSVHRLAEPPSLSFSRIAFHLACIRPTRRRLLRFMRTGPRAMGRSLWVTQWFPIVVLVTRKRRTSNHWKEERDEAIEWSVWRILLILSANHSTMESLAGSLVIITALKTHTFTIVLTRISQLLAHNFSHIKLCEDVYIYIYLFDRTFQLAVRTTTPVARTSLHHHLYPVFRSKQLARAWYGISLTTVFLADGRTKRIGSERVASVTRAACTHHTTCTSCIVFHAR